MRGNIYNTYGKVSFFTIILTQGCPFITRLVLNILCITENLIMKSAA